MYRIHKIKTDFSNRILSSAIVLLAPTMAEAIIKIGKLVGNIPHVSVSNGQSVFVTTRTKKIHYYVTPYS